METRDSLSRHGLRNCTGCRGRITNQTGVKGRQKNKKNKKPMCQKFMCLWALALASVVPNSSATLGSETFHGRTASRKEVGQTSTLLTADCRSTSANPYHNLLQQAEGMVESLAGKGDVRYQEEIETMPCLMMRKCKHD